MKSLYKSKIVLAFFFTLSSFTFAQSTLKGVVVDSLTQESLVGATVFLVGTSLGSACDIEGEYRITNIPDGKYNVRISYVGYKTKFVEMIFRNKQVIDMFFQLNTDAIEGKTITVSAQALGQAAAINQQISSNTIVNIISEQKIKELPDVNAAESIGRLPGVSILRSGGEANKVILRGLSDKYTAVTIDGVRMASTDVSSRGLDLSTISQSSLAGIELFKALTPDKDADAIAGSINLVSKKAPSLRELDVIARGNYNQLMKSASQYDFSFKYGERFFDNLLGVQLNGNLENKIRSNEKIDLDYDQTINNQTDYEINNFKLFFTEEVRKRNGFGVLLDYATPDEGSVKFNTVFNSTSRDYLRHTRDYPAGGGTGGTVTYGFRDREQEITTFNTALTGDNNLFEMKFTWGLSFAQSNSEFPYDFELSFLEPSILNTAGMKVAPRPKTNPEVLIPFAYNNFNAATLYDANYITQENLEKEKSAYLNVTKKYNLSDLFSGELKAGGKYKSKSRSNISSLSFAPYYLGYWQPYTMLDNGTIVPKNLSGTLFDAFFQRFLKNPINNSVAFSEFLDGNPDARAMYDLYSMYPLINRDKLRQWYDLNKKGVDRNGIVKEFNFDPSEKANYYDITEAISSFYIMNTLNIGQEVTFIAGVRIESEDNFYKSKYSPIQTGGFPIPQDASRDTSAAFKQTIVLPNFHLNFKPTEYLSIRLAAYKALSRPDFNYRLNTYFAWRPQATGATKQLILGNPLLKTAQGWNFEINTSVYGNDIGLVSVSAFYKQIEDMYHLLSGLNTSGNKMIESLGLNWKSLHTGTYSLTVPYNSPKPSKVWGVEFEHQINFRFLPGLLKNIVLSYNASFVRSETFLIASKTDTIKYFIQPFPFPFYRYEERPIEVKQQLESQPKFFGNVSLGYDIAGFSFRISVFHQSEYNISFTPSGRGDQIRNPYTRIDLALKQQITENISAILNISNLTDIKEENTIFNRVNGYKILNTSERYGTTADFGVKISL
ncbi:MAG: TonB-dependent receptor [Ignavibacteria bacterium]|nr:MAG: TonB-dependent receptor [Ignavibacteria bacterium]KAF0161906.1 MAG: TonB-dependent receptor [Ignavibacteria bacterium]